MASTVAGWLCALALVGPLRAAESEVSEGFESPETAWTQGSSDVQVRLIRHTRDGQVRYRGNRSEHVELQAGLGTFAHLTLSVTEARVIEELQPSIWLHSDRAGLSLHARVVFPSTIDPGSGRPMTALVPGDSYTQVGLWQSLGVRGIPLNVTRQARYLRAKTGVDVDPRGAFVDQLVLNAYGGPGTTRLWIDEMRVVGLVRPAQASTIAFQAPVQGQASTTPSSVTSGVALVNSVLTVDGRPFFPRAIEHRGESLAFLRSLGINTIVVQTPPSPKLAADAAREQLWFVAPPPSEAITAAEAAGLAAQPVASGQPRSPDVRPAVLPEISTDFDRVLAWNLGEALSADQLEATKNLERTLRRADRRRRRPLIAEPATLLRNYSRHIDYLLVRREPLGGTHELGDYLTWLVERPQLARPGTLAWATVQTEFSSGFIEQWRLLGQAGQEPPTIDADRMRLVAVAAVAAGHRGVIFRSRTRLDAQDPASRRRAAAIELANLDLQLLEPWGTSGVPVAVAETGDANIRAPILRTPRATLVLPLWVGPASQCVPGQAASNNLTLTIPGVPESHNAYEVTPAGFQKLWHKRVAGGLRVNLEEFGLTSLVVLTHDPLAVAGLTARLDGVQPRAAQIARDLAVARQISVEQVDRRLRALGRPIAEADHWLGQARAGLGQADRQLNSGNFSAAYQQAERALRPLRMLERAHWEQATRGLAAASLSPLTVCFETLPGHWALGDSLRSGHMSGNLLVGGDFEEPQRIAEFGWRHLRHDVPGVIASAGFNAEQPFSGKSCLRLKASAAKPELVPRLVESAPVWVTTPDVTVGNGQLVRIHGFLRIDSPLSATLDGLEIIDSVGGDGLAWRIGRTNGWQEFVLYRASGESGTLRVTFALTGLGEALIDDVTIETVQGPTWPRAVALRQ